MPLYAQLDATVSGNCGCSVSQMGFYISSVYEVRPLTNANFTYNLTLTSFSGEDQSQTPILISLYFMTGNGVTVSPSYSFQYPT